MSRRNEKEVTEDIAWQSEYSEMELAALKGQLQLYWDYINSPTMWSYHILKPVRDEFLERFGSHVTE